MLRIALLENATSHPYNAVVMSEKSEQLPGVAEKARPAETVAIVGVGLIGGSVAAALKACRGANRIIGVGRSRSRLAAAEAAGLIDDVTDCLSEAAACADLILFCTPVDRIVAGVREALPACRPGTLLTDAGSVKRSICEELSDVRPDNPRHPGVEFIGSHPLAGSEKQGFEAADATLYNGRVCVVTPSETTSDAGRQRVKRFWSALGANVVELSPAAHDRALATTSHLPHLVASVLAGTLDMADSPLAATGFRDTTRIASGDASLWASILLGNAGELLTSLENFENLLGQFRWALKTNDRVTLEAFLVDSKRKRDALPAMTRTAPEEH